MNPSTSGFTLIEVLIAMALLGFAVMGSQAVITDRLLRNVDEVDERATARQLVGDRIQLIQTDPGYSDLEARFEGTEGSIINFPGYSRRTLLDPRTDHTVVTVRVITPSATDTVSGTTVIGIP